MTKETAADVTPPPTDEASVAANPSKLRKVLSWTWAKLRFCLWNRYVAFSLFILAVSEVLSRASQLSAVRFHLRMEAPLLVGLYWGLNFVLRPRKVSPIVAALPIVVFYIGFDVFYLAWGDVFKAIDAQNLPELLKVLRFSLKAPLVLALALPIVLLLCYVNYRRYWRLLVMSALAVLLVGTLELRPGAALRAFDKASFDVAEWSDAESVNRNGRFTSMIYSEARRRQALADTASYRNRPDYDLELRATAELLRTYGNRRNVHVLVLESFLDPTLFSAVTFSKDPRHPDFAALVGKNQGFSISPVFGGETAQAEFEALCGVPALQKLAEIEFDDFTGEAAGCMPGILGQAGYSTMVSNSFEPNYFNSTKAYTGAGFENIYFPREYGSVSTSYLTASHVSESEQYMFDGDLFEQNLAFVAQTLHDNPGRPLFNYVLGIYGHDPHDIDTEKRPLVISVKSAQDDERLLRAANQYFYRTQAIAGYVRALMKLDPKGLIIIVSDHLPPLAKGVNTYKEYQYLNNIEGNTHLNRILVFENGKIVRHRTIHHYEIPSLIYDYLTGNKYCAKNKCDLSEAQLEQKYMSLMAHAVGQQ